MDLTGIKKGILKYKYVWIVLITGMILMLIPAQPAEKVEIQEQAERLEMDSDLEKRLEEMLCAVSNECYTWKRIWKRAVRCRCGGLLKVFLNIGFKWHNKKNEKNQKKTSKQR